MPDLLYRAITLQPFRQLAVSSQLFSRLHIRRSHGAAAASSSDSLHHSQPTVNEDNPPSRLRKHGFKSLPLSPLMHTEDASAHKRRTQPSADEAMKAFQKEVAMNPYGLSTSPPTSISLSPPSNNHPQAQALATPVRYCSITLANLPSYFLLPFTTLIEKTPAPDDASTQPYQVKVRFQPGRSSDHPSKETLAQTSYIINRQDAVRHLSRKRHWTFLVLERQKAKVASIARRSSNSQKLVQDLWVWENQVDAMGEYLERKVVEEVVRASRTATDAEHDTSSEVLELRFLAVDSGDVATTTSGEADTIAYDLTTLLPSEALDSIASHAVRDVTAGVWKVKGSRSLPIRLAIEKLKSYKESNEIKKALPMAQNPAGSREARLAKLGSRSGEGKEES